MLAEALLALACINGPGCSQTASAYSEYRPAVKDSIEQLGRRVPAAVGYLSVAAGGTVSLPIYRTPLVLSINPQKVEVSYAGSF